MDACTALNNVATASVSKNPIDGDADNPSGFVSDHVVINNPEVRIQGVISNSDFGIFKPKSDVLTTIGAVSIVNNQTVDGVIGVIQSESDLRKNIGGSNNTALSVESYTIQNALSYNEVDTFLNTVLNKSELVDIYLFDYNMVIVKSYFDYICTSYQSDENEKTGDNPDISLTFEKPTIVTSRKVNVKIVEVKAAKGKNSGNKTGSESGSPAIVCLSRLEDVYKQYDKPASNAARLEAGRKIISAYNSLFGTAEAGSTVVNSQRINQMYKDMKKKLQEKDVACPFQSGASGSF